ncbi:MAG: 2-C-methyl-D-erythritol 2,4-cyclodiphosphate synthase [Proteobacteria bacterium]|nr:2-C-methyl-D-erythritol 2,4-cyclodiphosphate synthase [Pseudomonadota bacterium]
MKIGQGFDLHKLVNDRPLIIGGVIIPFDKGLLGHSDADVLLHAITDALIGAAGLGDIGAIFPDTEDKYKDANSRTFLREIGHKLKSEHGYMVNNIDATVIIEKPKLREYIDLMRQNIADDLEIHLEQVNIKAKTSEGIGIVGQGLAAIAQAVVLLIK